MLKKLKKAVCEANLMLPKLGLVIFSWGNVSGIDRKKGLMVIKPSGVSYDELTPEMMVVVDLNGKVVEGELKPSSDTVTHLRLYEAFPNISGIVHTHSTYATAFAQAGLSIPAYGTTHADHFHGMIPCTRALHDWEIEEAYEWETGNVIVETFSNLDPTAVPAAVVHSHGPFTWGDSPKDAAKNAAVLEQVAKMAWLSRALRPDMNMVGKTLLDKHFYRKRDDYGN